MRIGATEITSCKIGSTQVNEVRIGGTLIWSYSSFDPDAQLFITNAAITDTTQKAAIDKLVVDLKGYGIWSKMKALYPFVGGTAAQHKFNLKNPLDSDAAFRLVFSGGWTHSSNGALPNGTNGYANTYFNPVTQALSKDSAHISYYRRNASTGTLIGAINGGPQIRFALTPNYGSGFGNITEIVSSANQQNTTAISEVGLLNGNRNSSTEFKIFTNNTLKQTVTRTSVIQPNYNIYIGAVNIDGTSGSSFNSGECALASIGDGLTDTEASNFYTAVQAFQTTLGRQV